LKNSIAHFANIEVLEFVMAHFAQAIKLFFDLWIHLPNQCVVIDQFKDIKKTFP
jgi:hypothetical protein